MNIYICRCRLRVSTAALSSWIKGPDACNFLPRRKLTSVVLKAAKDLLPNRLTSLYSAPSCVGATAPSTNDCVSGNVAGQARFTSLAAASESGPLYCKLARKDHRNLLLNYADVDPDFLLDDASKLLGLAPYTRGNVRVSSPPLGA